MSSALVACSLHWASQSPKSCCCSTAIERFIRLQLSDWMTRGWAEVKAKERGFARRGVAVMARRTRMVLWNCIVGLIFGRFLVLCSSWWQGRTNRR